MELHELFESAPELRDLNTDIECALQQFDEVTDYVLHLKHAQWTPEQIEEQDRVGWGPFLIGPPTAPNGREWDESSALAYAVCILRVIERDRTALLRQAVQIASQPAPRPGLRARLTRRPQR
jgi:hypothetical protein